MMEEKWERVGEETSLQHMHLKKKKKQERKKGTKSLPL
jgi:hypothetical protein